MSKLSDDSAEDRAKLERWKSEKPVVKIDPTMYELITIMLRLIAIIPGCRGRNIYDCGDATAIIYLPGYIWDEERLVRKVSDQ
jgi:hypothetical protein